MVEKERSHLEDFRYPLIRFREERSQVFSSKQSIILTNNTLLRILTAYTKRLKGSNNFARALSNNETFYESTQPSLFDVFCTLWEEGQKSWLPVTFKTTFDSRLLLFPDRSATTVCLAVEPTYMLHVWRLTSLFCSHSSSVQIIKPQQGQLRMSRISGVERERAIVFSSRRG